MQQLHLELSLTRQSDKSLGRNMVHVIDTLRIKANY